MPLLLFPVECFNNILFFLDDKSLYKCLFVNRYWCRFSVPMLWEEPFNHHYVNMHSMVLKANIKFSTVIITLLSCLNEDEISSLIPCSINFNNQSPLFDYGNFVRKINHENCVHNIITWLKSSGEKVSTFEFGQEFQDCSVQKLINAIYRMIMRQGSNLQEFNLTLFDFYIDLPEFSIFTPGIKNLRTIDVALSRNKVYYQNTIEFLSMTSKLCNGIIDCNLWIPSLNGQSAYVNPVLDIIKLQPLEKMLIYSNNVDESIKKIIYTLKFRSETLKRLFLRYLDFQDIDLSFILKLGCLERLGFENCKGFTYKHYEVLSKRKLLLKELKLWFGVDNFDLISNDQLSIIETITNSLCNEALYKLSLDIVTPEIIKVVKEFCPKINFLEVAIGLKQFLDSIIPLICELSSLKTLNIRHSGKVDAGLLVKILGDHLISVENLSLNFHFDIQSFEYFTINCKANLKKLLISISKYNSWKDYLTCVNNYQKIHKSLKVFGVDNIFEFNYEELKIVDSLKNQSVDVVFPKELKGLFDM